MRQEGREIELRYFREGDGRDVDFSLVEKNKPQLFLKCKLSEGPVHPGLKYFAAKCPEVNSWQIHLHGKKDYRTPEGIRAAPAVKLLSQWV